MKRRIVLPLVLLCALTLVALLALSATAAASPTGRAQFGVMARGDCLVDLPDAAGGREYVEVASGLLTAQGQGLVAGIAWFKGVPVYVLDTTSLKVGGLVSASWAHDGVSYEFRARLYATPDTDTFLGTTQDHIILGTSEEADWTTLSYSGVFMIDGERTQVEGGCCVVAGPNMGIPTVTMKFIIADSQPFGLVWAEEAGIVDLWGPYPSPSPCPAADRFDYWVKVAQSQQAKNTIIVATDPYYPPFEMLENHKIVGF